jgi:hypothetical protein
MSVPTEEKSYQQSYEQPDKLSVDKFMANNLAIQNIFRIFMGGFFLKKKNYTDKMSGSHKTITLWTTSVYRLCRGSIRRCAGVLDQMIFQ